MSSLMHSYRHSETVYVGIICLYYEQYAFESVCQFHSLLSELSPIPRLILVLNNPSIDENRLPCFDFHCIAGSNKLGEFSAWEEGIQFYCSHVNIHFAANDFFVFANYTFCHHRIWKHSYAKNFCRSLRKANSSSPSIIGWGNYSVDLFSIDSIPFHIWISTYLFSFQMSTYVQLEGGLVPSDSSFDRYISPTIDSDSFFGYSVNEALQSHLTNWLFKGGWRNSKALDSSSYPVLQFKAKCILAEKLLSAKILSLGGRLILLDNFNLRARFILRRLHLKFSRLITLLLPNNSHSR